MVTRFIRLKSTNPYQPRCHRRPAPLRPVADVQLRGVDHSIQLFTLAEDIASPQPPS